MSLPYCAGLIMNGSICAKHKQCALYRLWWQTPGTDMNLCGAPHKYDRFVPSVIGPAEPVAVTTLPIGKTMELFA